MLDCDGLSQTLFVITGSALGMEVSLDYRTIPFGLVVPRNSVERSVTLHNTGDIGTRWYFNTNNHLTHLLTLCFYSLSNLYVETQVYLGHGLDLSRSRDHSICHRRFPVGTDTLCPKDFEILRLNCIWVTVLTFFTGPPALYLLIVCLCTSNCNQIFLVFQLW